MMVDTVVYFQKINGNYYEEEIRQLLRGKIQFARGNCAAALSYCWLAKRTYGSKTDLAKRHVFDKELADTYACLGRLDSAIYFYQTALVTPDSVQLVAILAALSKMYEMKGDYSKALDYEQKREELEKRIFTKDKEQAIGRLQAKIALEKREREWAAQESQARLNWVLMASGLVILSLVVIIGFFAFKRKQQELLLAEQTQELLRQEQQLKERTLLATKQELLAKNTALAEVTEQLDLKNLLIRTLEMKMTNNSHAKNAEKDTELDSLKILTPEDWRRFRTLFEERYTDFFPKLSLYYPKLTTSEIRLLLLIKLGFGSKETADILGISSTSVYVSRSRLRKRLNLAKDDDLEKFIQTF
jgi:DNA-binding CsgD family transcriptional regulator/tetratricopeptide (TPR) repeat protein